MSKKKINPKLGHRNFFFFLFCCFNNIKMMLKDCKNIIINLDEWEQVDSNQECLAYKSSTLLNLSTYNSIEILNKFREIKILTIETEEKLGCRRNLKKSLWILVCFKTNY